MTALVLLAVLVGIAALPPEDHKTEFIAEHTAG